MWMCTISTRAGGATLLQFPERDYRVDVGGMFNRSNPNPDGRSSNSDSSPQRFSMAGELWHYFQRSPKGLDRLAIKTALPRAAFGPKAGVRRLPL
jgi:hypothetical protein